MIRLKWVVQPQPRHWKMSQSEDLFTFLCYVFFNVVLLKDKPFCLGNVNTHTHSKPEQTNDRRSPSNSGSWFACEGSLLWTGLELEGKVEKQMLINIWTGWYMIYSTVVFSDTLTADFNPDQKVSRVSSSLSLCQCLFPATSPPY